MQVPSIRLQLIAGQQVVLEASDATVQVTIEEGTVEIAGVMPPLQTSFHLVRGRGLHLYTYEGGALRISSTATDISEHREATSIGEVLKLARTLSTMATTRTLVVGAGPRCGKSLAAATLCNVLARAPSTPSVTLVDVDVGQSVVVPGCVAATDVVAAHPLWVGQSAAPESSTVAMFSGLREVTVATLPIFLHHVAQIVESAQALARGAGPSRGQHLVIDTPCPTDMPMDVFVRRLIDVVQPTHVVGIGDCAAIRASVARAMPQVNVSQIPALAAGLRGADTAALVAEYFVGSPSEPLGCSHVVVRLSALKFFKLWWTGTAAKAVPLAPSAMVLRHRVCAVSHAATEQEVAFANVAGAVVVTHVDVDEDAVSMIVPADATAGIPRGFVVVPPDVEMGGLAPFDPQTLCFMCV